MSFDPASLIVSLVLGSIGFVAFVYGKRQSRVPHMVAGALLTIFPVFISNALVAGAVGVGIIALWFLAVRLGL